MEKDEDILNKKDITSISNPNDILTNIRGIRYKNKKNNQSLLGVISQDIKSNVPEAIVDKYKVDYTQLVALLIECIKSNNQEIKSLKADIKTLKVLLNSS
tara:strand:- start:595 stop:894 length:300 start_codon:yes stop_codon:yes gene_type:complete